MELYRYGNSLDTEVFELLYDQFQIFLLRPTPPSVVHNDPSPTPLPPDQCPVWRVQSLYHSRTVELYLALLRRQQKRGLLAIQKHWQWSQESLL